MHSDGNSENGMEKRFCQQLHGHRRPPAWVRAKGPVSGNLRSLFTHDELQNHLAQEKLAASSPWEPQGPRHREPRAIRPGTGATGLRGLPAAAEGSEDF